MGGNDLNLDPSVADLVVGATYIGHGGIAAEPISKLLPVGNRGGIRYAGSSERPSHMALFMTSAESEWPDALGRGSLTYWGDNRRPGRELHETPKRGNLVLRNVFQAAWDKDTHWMIPLICLFAHEAGTRNVQLLGVMAPGGMPGDPDEDLVAVWRKGEEGWFQNYRAKFTALPADRVPRATVADWPTMSRNQREKALPGFGDWLNRPPANAG